jgi:hypothetical protein
MKYALGLFLSAACCVSAQQTLWGQCGGNGWTGPTTCVSGSVCKVQNEWYSQCVTGDAPAPAPSSASSARPSSSAASSAAGSGTGTAGLPAATGTFSWDRKTFFVNGNSFQIVGGQIDPQRVPKAYWAHRLQMAKSMGLNTIFSYLYWQDIEKYPGKFDFTGNNDIVAWHEEVQKAGLKAVLRPGPYVCAERDWGGLPGWLSQISGMKIRSNNQPFLDATAKYLAQVGALLKPFLITNGGPILMVQIENEYGYVGSDKAYTGALANILKTHFPNMKLYTNDGPQAGALRGGQVPGALSVVDGTDSKGGFALRDQVITDQSSLGPLMNGEYWVRWFDTWGPRQGHSSYDGDVNGMNGRANELDWVLSGGNHFSLFMFHGGTSFNFGNGAGDNSPRSPMTTSYDYGAALDETGRPAQIYNYFRTAIAKHVSNIPAVPSVPALQSISDFTLTPVLGMFDTLPEPRYADRTLVMEATGQVFGYILYEHVLGGPASGVLVPGSGAPRDRIIVYVNGVKRGVIDGIYRNPAQVTLNGLQKGDKVWLLVENLGRADNGFSDQTKGIVGDVTIGGTKLTYFNHYNFPLDTQPAAALTAGPKTVPANSPPVWYRGTFTNPNSGLAADTFLQLPNGVKGLVFVNGNNIGRYWAVGPQQELFVPGAYLNQGANNTVLVLELSPGTSSRVARGVSKRTWKNNPDPECNNCS